MANSTASASAAPYATLRESLVQAAVSPINRLRRALNRNGTGSAGSESHIWALKDVGFEVKPGEVVGIIGRNGAGKSTLLKILSRVTEPTEGKVDLYGRVGSLLEVGTGFHPELTGRENIYLNGAILGMSRREISRNLDAIIAFAEIEKFLDTPVKRYSSGLYVRLAFAVAAHLEPEILLVDEVLSVGDAAFQKKCLGKVGDAAVQGRTVLLVTHNMSVVLQMCVEAILMRKGRMALRGQASEVVQHYLSESRNWQDQFLDLAACQRRTAIFGGAKLLSCHLTTPEKTAPWELPYAAEVCVEVAFTAARDLPNFELGLAVSTATGFEVASPLSSDSIEQPFLRPGRYTFRVSLGSLKLAPGCYILGLGLRSDRGMEDYIQEAAYLDVSPTPESSSARLHWRRGVVVPDSRFVLHETLVEKRP